MRIVDVQPVIDKLKEAIDRGMQGVRYHPVSAEAVLEDIEKLPEPKTQLFKENTTKDATFDTISRQAAIEALKQQAETMNEWSIRYAEQRKGVLTAVNIIEDLPPAEPEPLTDKEQRIFLAAMGREEKVCEEVDRNHVREPYEDSLMRVCKEIRRKVKGALWT